MPSRKNQFHEDGIAMGRQACGFSLQRFLPANGVVFPLLLERHQWGEAIIGNSNDSHIKSRIQALIDAYPAAADDSIYVKPVGSAQKS
jgi:hypothetical protein